MPTHQKGSSFLPLLIVLIVLGAASWMLFQGPPSTPQGEREETPTVSGEEQKEAVTVGPGETRQDSVGRVETGPAIPQASLAKGGIQGSVVNTAGEGIAGATVVFTQQFEVTFGTESPSNPLVASRTTNAKGEFRFDRLPQDASFGMWVRHPEYAPKEGTPVRSLGEDQVIAPVTLNQGYALRGTVADSGGNPLAAALILHRQAGRFDPRSQEELEEENLKMGRLVHLNADEQGTFEINLLPEGLWTLRARHDGYATAQIHPIVLMGDNTLMEQEVVLGPEHTLAGRVVDVEGAPVSGARIDVSRIRPRPMLTADTQSAEDGSFEVRGLPEGLYGIAASMPGFSNASLPRVQSGKSDLELVLQQKAGVSGTITSANGSPATAFSIQLMSMNRGNAMYIANGQSQSFTNPEGKYLLESIEPGTYRLLVTSPHATPTYSPSFTVQRESVQGLHVQLQEGGTLSGFVREAFTGKPIPGARIVLHGKDWTKDNAFGLFGGVGPDPNNVPEQATVSRQDGSFLLNQAFPGELKVEINHPAYLPQTALVTLGSGQSIEMGTYELSAGGTVSGIGKDGQGNPLAGGTAYLTKQTDQAFGYYADNQRLDARGRFHFEGLEAGSYKISVASAKGAGMLFLAEVDGSSQTVYVEPGKTIEVSLVSTQ